MTTFLMLPDELVLNCLARVSRLYYPTLSLVSKRFRSFLTSMELYRIRTLLGRTESCLYLFVRNHSGSIPLSRFTVHQILLNSSRKVLAPISSPDTLPMYLPHNVIGQQFAVVGHNMYVIGGQINNKASSRVMVMDCRSHTWREAPNMQLGRTRPSTCVLDGKIYVVGGCKNSNITNWMEVFDTKTQTWELVSGPCEDLCICCTEYDGKVNVVSMEKTYELHNGRWREVAMDIGLLCSGCVIDNVRYDLLCRSHRLTICWFDSEERSWKKLMGEMRLFSNDRSVSNIMMENCGGKLAVVWEECLYDELRHHWEKRIRCAEITIDRRRNGEIWGTIEWVDVVVNTGRYHLLTHAFVVTL